jgi:hypothetical protein
MRVSRRQYQPRPRNKAPRLDPHTGKLQETLPEPEPKFDLYRGATYPDPG